MQKKVSADGLEKGLGECQLELEEAECVEQEAEGRGWSACLSGTEPAFTLRRKKVGTPGSNLTNVSHLVGNTVKTIGGTRQEAVGEANAELDAGDPCWSPGTVRMQRAGPRRRQRPCSSPRFRVAHSPAVQCVCFAIA